MDRRDRPAPLRDLPDPPRRSRDNYASAVAQVYRALDEAEMVAPDEADRQWVKQTRKTVRTELMTQIDMLGEEDHVDG